MTIRIVRWILIKILYAYWHIGKLTIFIGSRIFNPHVSGERLRELEKFAAYAWPFFLWFFIWQRPAMPDRERWRNALRQTAKYAVS